MVSDPSRILVISLRRLGDLLLTTPLIRSLRRGWPEATIDVLAFRGAAGIIAGNPDVNRVIGISERPNAAESLRIVIRLWRSYDLAVSTQSGDRPTFFAFVAGRRRAGITNPEDGWLARSLKRATLQTVVPSEKKIHRVEQMLRLVDSLGIARVPELVGPMTSDTAHIVSEDKFAVVHASPMFAYKEWTPAGWRAVAAGLTERGLSVIAIGGPGDSERAYLEEVWRGCLPFHQLKWSETMGLLRQARVFVGPDTSTTHLAAAAGCPTVALFGPMDPRVWGPWPVGGLTAPWAASGTIQHQGNIWIVQNPLPCVPCTFEG